MATVTPATASDMAERRRAARAIAENARRRALPRDVAAVSIGLGASRLFVAAPHLGLPELRAAALRGIDEPSAPPRLLIVVRNEELRPP